MRGEDAYEVMSVETWDIMSKVREDKPSIVRDEREAHKRVSFII
jgi:hypothetical protein